jgi:hypothetical protein
MVRLSGRDVTRIEKVRFEGFQVALAGVVVRRLLGLERGD